MKIQKKTVLLCLLSISIVQTTRPYFGIVGSFINAGFPHLIAYSPFIISGAIVTYYRIFIKRQIEQMKRELLERINLLEQTMPTSIDTRLSSRFTALHNDIDTLKHMLALCSTKEDITLLQNNLNSLEQVLQKIQLDIANLSTKLDTSVQKLQETINGNTEKIINETNTLKQTQSTLQNNLDQLSNTIKQHQNDMLQKTDDVQKNTA